jgi:hypothetical protein
MCCLTGQLIYIPSYFDFVRVRKFLRDAGADFRAVSEDTPHPERARARDLFADGRVPRVVYTERAQFYHAVRFRGIQVMFCSKFTHLVPGLKILQCPVRGVTHLRGAPVLGFIAGNVAVSHKRCHSFLRQCSSAWLCMCFCCSLCCPGLPLRRSVNIMM